MMAFQSTFRCHSSHKVDNFDVVPNSCNSLCNEVAVTLRWKRFAAKQAGPRSGKRPLIKDVRHVSHVHESRESFNVPGPIVVTSVVAEDIFRWSKDGKMLVFTIDESTQKKRWVASIRKSGQLSARFEASIDHTINPGILQHGEEALGGLLLESDRV